MINKRAKLARDVVESKSREFKPVDKPKGLKATKYLAHRFAKKRQKD
jgi:chorismate mutase